MTCGPAVRRVLDETPEVELLEMDWDEHWADVRFLDPGFGMGHLQKKLMPAGAWCDFWPEE
ncbi:MAG: hypothetical protein Kow00129_17540 [Thermoleophilia bacterium]